MWDLGLAQDSFRKSSSCLWEASVPHPVLPLTSLGRQMNDLQPKFKKLSVSIIETRYEMFIIVLLVESVPGLGALGLN